MSAPDPEGMSLLGKVVAAGAAVATPIVWLWKQLDKKADRDEVKKALDHIEKLYGNAEKDRAFTRDLHDKAMSEIRNNQTEIIRILAGRQQ